MSYISIFDNKMFAILVLVTCTSAFSFQMFTVLYVLVAYRYIRMMILVFQIFTIIFIIFLD